MFIMKNKFVILPIIVFFNFLALNSQQIPKQEETLKHMLLANNYFMVKYPDPCQPTFVHTLRSSNIWTRAVYFEGLMAFHAIYPQKEFYDYALKWRNSINGGWIKGLLLVMQTISVVGRLILICITFVLMIPIKSRI